VVTPLVSICVASYRRPHGLARLLTSLERLELPEGVEVETIVVDNDAEESARAVVAGYAEGGASVVYCVEPRRNIAHARNRAVEAARGRWIAFIDDDEAAEPRWLAAYLELAARRDADAFFGPVLPRLEAIATPWLDAETFYTRPRHATGTAIDRGEARTGNAFVSAKIFDGRRFDPAFGASGGEDAELFAHIGAPLLWCDEARVVEFVPPERHRPAWLLRRAFRGGYVHTRLALHARPAAIARLGLPRALLAGTALLAALPIAALGGRRRALQVALRLWVQAGHVFAHLRGRHEPYAA
jgi:glycosyltransferase involved in cell wall biosynthesis